MSPSFCAAASAAVADLKLKQERTSIYIDFIGREKRTENKNAVATKESHFNHSKFQIRDNHNTTWYKITS